MLTQFNRTIRPSTFLFIAAAFAVGCGSEEDTPEIDFAAATVSTGEIGQGDGAGNSPGEAVAQHPEFEALIDRAATRAGTVFASFMALSDGERAEVTVQLNTCMDEGAAACGEVAESLGVDLAEVWSDRTIAGQIMNDAGLGGAPAGQVRKAFRGAQLLTQGSGAGSELVSIIEGTGVVCVGDCAEFAGNLIGASVGGSTANLALSNNDDGEGGGGGALVTAGAIVALAAAIADLWDRLFGPNDDDECLEDSDCPSGDYCHKSGVNDCRPELAEGKLCARNGACESNCCKPHISAAFLPICRPASKCN